jgi:hypothetical protein
MLTKIYYRDTLNSTTGARLKNTAAAARSMPPSFRNSPAGGSNVHDIDF